MFTAIARGAYLLDRWLQEHIGRPYNTILGIGLVIEIVRGATELSAKLKSPQELYGAIFQIVLGSALLVHQLGAFSEHLERRGEGRRRGRSQ